MSDVPSCDVSVIVPTFNRPGLLRRALESVARQTAPPTEIIVVDDASDQSVEPIAAELARKIPIRVVRHETNKGPAAARNTGIRAAKGTYVAFLDCDDEWLPEKLERQLAFLAAAERSSNLAVASTTGFVLSRRGQSTVRVPSDHRSAIDIVWGCSLSPGSTLLCRRSLFDDFGTFDEQFRRFEDWAWLLRFVGPGQVCVLPAALAQVNVGVHPSADIVRENCGVLLERELSAESRLSPALQRRLRSSLQVEIAASLHKEGHTALTISNTIESMLIFPFRNFQFYRHLLSSILETNDTAGRGPAPHQRHNDVPAARN